jgi:hypothetical protein
VFEKLLAKRHIRHLDLSSIRAKLVEKLGWTEDRVKDVELSYKRFLYALAHKDTGDIISPPSLDVDEFWHQHILDTRKYRDDCETIFGHYMDHTPGLDSESQKRADSRRWDLYNRYNIGGIDFNDEPSYSAGGDGGDWIGSSDGGHTNHGLGVHGCDVTPGHSSTDSGHGCNADAAAAGSSDSGGGGGSDGGGGDGGGGGCGGGGCGGG